jgi:L-aminopeptidase/D-esterase-like protein
MGGSFAEEKRRPSLTDIDGILVGHHTLPARPTGCTVIMADRPFTAAVDVRGGAPGTRETDLLRPENMVDRIDAVVLSGGSAFGLDAASGAVRFLEEAGRGFQARGLRIPIVCSAILFDLALGDGRVRPDARAGYEAAKAATRDPVAEGNVGAGAGASVGKLLGMESAMKAGLGSWALSRPDGVQVGAIVALNAGGDIRDPATGKLVAGARGKDGRSFADVSALLRQGHVPGDPLRENTVIAVVATNVPGSKSDCLRIAQMAQDAIARCVSPAHAPWDGDTVFALSTGSWKAPAGRVADPGLVGALAADVLATAILRAVEQAEPWGPLPSARSLRNRN